MARRTVQKVEVPETKLFILDTNVLLYDYTSLYSFKENDIILPIVVLEELDTFKKGNDLINFQAREFIRELDKLSSKGKGSLQNGIQLGKDRGKLFVECGRPTSKIVRDSFPTDTPDHRILAIADKMSKKYSGRYVSIVTKDINLRMKAKSLGIKSEDYETGKAKHTDVTKPTAYIYEDYDIEVIDKVHKGEELNIKDLELNSSKQTQFYILKNGSRSVLSKSKGSQLFKVNKNKAYGITPRNAEQTFAMSVLLDSDIELVAITGKAGTGKTLLALASAVEQRKEYRQIYLARPVVPMGNRDIGYLPGDIQSKLDPYMQPLWDNLSVIKHRFKADSTDFIRINEMVENEKITVAPLTYIRGRSLENAFFITDEAQNLTPHEIKTIITRAGAGTKMVFTGDLQQIDTPYLDSQSNGLAYLIDRMSNQSLFAHIHLEKGERSKLSELASDLL